MMDPLEVKKRSEQVILAAGGKVCNWLPWIDDRKLRSREDIVARALILHAMITIAFEAPIPMIRDWITRNGLDKYLAASERAILAKTNEQLTEQETTNLMWSVEALWAFMWLGGLTDTFGLNTPLDDDMASLGPTCL